VYIYKSFIKFLSFTSRIFTGTYSCMLSGQELLDWSSLLEIEPHSLVIIFHMDGDTFVITAHEVSMSRSQENWKNDKNYILSH